MTLYRFQLRLSSKTRDFGELELANHDQARDEAINRASLILTEQDALAEAQAVFVVATSDEGVIFRIGISDVTRTSPPFS